MIVYREIPSLERDLGFSARTLYGVSNNIAGHYHSVRIPKKSGGFRTLSVPDTVLKSIQRRIAEVLLRRMPVSGYARAYRDGGSAFKNARPHVGKAVVLKLDILHFFDSIRYSAVKDAAFPEDRYSEPIRILLAMLCYHGDVLPQGAPSSPAITNIILYDFDERVGAWCRERRISYTRYCDDMTFSGSFDPGEVVDFVRAELKGLGFLLNTRKTRVQRAGTQQLVTGVVVNERVRVPVRYRTALRQELYFCRKYGVEDHIRKTGLAVSKERCLQQLLGRVNYVLQTEPGDDWMRRSRDWILQQQKEKPG